MTEPNVTFHRTTRSLYGEERPFLEYRIEGLPDRTEPGGARTAQAVVLLLASEMERSIAFYNDRVAPRPDRRVLCRVSTTHDAVVVEPLKGTDPYSVLFDSFKDDVKGFFKKRVLPFLGESGLV